MSSLTIGELARLVDAAPSALRYWERVGLLDQVERVDGHRRYPPGAIDRVGLIRLCQDAGFGIGEIRELLDADILRDDSWQPTGRAKLAELRAQIAQLEAAAEALEHVLSCPHPTLSECPTFAAFVRHRAAGGATAAAP